MSRIVTNNYNDVLVAPFSGDDCDVLRYQIEERRLSVPYLLPWYIIAHEAANSVGFEVQTSDEGVTIVELTQTVTLANQIVAITAADTDLLELIRSVEQESSSMPISTV